MQNNQKLMLFQALEASRNLQGPPGTSRNLQRLIGKKLGKKVGHFFGRAPALQSPQQIMDLQNKKISVAKEH